MLVVPKLSFPVLFGNNHLESCVYSMLDLDHPDNISTTHTLGNIPFNFAFDSFVNTTDHSMHDNNTEDNSLSDITALQPSLLEFRAQQRACPELVISFIIKQALTSEACKHLYSCNPTYKTLLKSMGGIRKILYHTASIEIVLEQATGSNNFTRVVGVSPVPLFNLDRLGGKYPTCNYFLRDFMNT